MTLYLETTETTLFIYEYMLTHVQGRSEAGLWKIVYFAWNDTLSSTQDGTQVFSLTALRMLNRKGNINEIFRLAFSCLRIPCLANIYETAYHAWSEQHSRRFYFLLQLIKHSSVNIYEYQHHTTTSHCWEKLFPFWNVADFNIELETKNRTSPDFGTRMIFVWARVVEYRPQNQLVSSCWPQKLKDIIFEIAYSVLELCYP